MKNLIINDVRISKATSTHRLTVARWRKGKKVHDYTAKACQKACKELLEQDYLAGYEKLKTLQGYEPTPIEKPMADIDLSEITYDNLQHEVSELKDAVERLGDLEGMLDWHDKDHESFQKAKSMIDAQKLVVIEKWQNVLP